MAPEAENHFFILLLLSSPSEGKVVSVIYIADETNMLVNLFLSERRSSVRCLLECIQSHNKLSDSEESFF